MTILDSMVQTGDWFFRWRSYLPLLLLPLFVGAFIGMEYRGDGYRSMLPWEVACLAVSLLGVAIRVWTVGTIASGTSGRNTAQQAARSLNTTGIYSLVRHPLYLANYFMFLGISLFPGQWYLPIIVTSLFLLYYERIIAREEVFLKERFGDEFESWAACTPALFQHTFRTFVRSPFPFSWRLVLSRESYGLFAIGVVFWVLSIGKHLALQHKLIFEPLWTTFAVLTFILFMILRSMKKAGLLAAPNR